MIEFANAMRQSGIDPPPDIIADGNLHRFHVTGDKPSTENGWFVLHDAPPAGAFGCWNRGGISEKWHGREYRTLTTEEKARYRANMEAAKRQRDEEQARIYGETREKAKTIWGKCKPAPADHPYLEEKGIKPHGLRESRGALVVPVRDTGGTLHGLQFIDGDGGKRFLTGTAKAGHYCAIGKPDGVIYLAEGYATGASIYESTGHAVAVAFDAGNLAPVAQALRAKFPELKMIVCGDNDTSGTGQKAAMEAALAVKGLVALPLEPGQDFNDLHKLQGGNSVRDAIEAATAPLPMLLTEERPARAELCGDEWPEPLPLMTDTMAEPYPVDALPGEIGEAVAEVQRFVKAPLALVAASALGALSTAAQSLVDVKRADKLNGPASLFLLSIAESGERKTTIDGFFTEAVRTYQHEEIEKAKPKLLQARADFSAWEAKRAGIVDAIKAASRQGKPTNQHESNLQAAERQKPIMPRVPELLRGDDTPEALAFDMANRWPAGAVISSEAGVVFGSAGMGKDRALRNLALLNVLWDGGELPIKRKTGENFTVRGARLTLSLQVQEATLLEFFNQTGQLARGTGFLARFLVAWPTSTQGWRLFTEAPKAWPHLSIFNNRLLELLRTPTPIQSDGTLTPSLLTFTPEAKAAWVEYHDQIETMLRTGGELCNVKDVASKSADNAARLAALFHAYQHGTASEIGADSFNRASRLAAWHLGEALRFFGGLSLPVELSAAARLEAWLLDYCKQNQKRTVARRIIQQYGPYGLRENPTLTAAIEELEELGRARLHIDGKKKDVLINPALLGV